MISVLIPLVARLGLPERFQRIAAWVIVVVAAIALLWALKAIYDRSVVSDYKQEQSARSVGATNRAAEQRADDAIRNSTNEKELHDAINAAPTGGVLSPAAHALACERLRKLGRTPPTCRPEIGN